MTASGMRSNACCQSHNSGGSARAELWLNLHLLLCLCGGVAGAAAAGQYQAAIHKLLLPCVPRAVSVEPSLLCVRQYL